MRVDPAGPARLATLLLLVACGPAAAPPRPARSQAEPPPAGEPGPDRSRTAEAPRAARAPTAAVVDVAPSLFEDRGPGHYELLGRSTRGPVHLAYRFMRSGEAADDREPGVTYSWNQDLIIVADARAWREAIVFAGDQQRMRRATTDEDHPLWGRRYWARFAPRSVGAHGYDEWYAWTTDRRLRPVDPLATETLAPLRFVLADGVEEQPIDADGWFVFRSRPSGLFLVRLVLGERTLWAGEAQTGSLACATPDATGEDEAELHVRVHALAEGQWIVVWARSRSRRDCPEATHPTVHEDDGGLVVVGPAGGTP